jgi:uncharacterized protein YqjF (DUF2071 family)
MEHWSKILAVQNHRPYPLPNGPWVMLQNWHQLLFAHWRVDPTLLQTLLPSAVTVDTYAGEAWVGVVPFLMSGVQWRGLPPIPGTDRFLELNVRTYVVVDGKPGVFFFSLDAENPLAVQVARKIYHLPYFDAEMWLTKDHEWVHYHSRRTHRGAPAGVFQGRYRPIEAVKPAEAGSLEHWFTERYCLYSFNVRTQRLYRGEIHHRPWPLQKASAVLTENSVAQSHGVLWNEQTPYFHYADFIRVLIWPLKRV